MLPGYPLSLQSRFVTIRWLWCANDKASGEKENLTWERVLRTLVKFLGASGATGSTRRVAHEKWIYRNIWSR